MRLFKRSILIFPRATNVISSFSMHFFTQTPSFSFLYRNFIIIFVDSKGEIMNQSYDTFLNSNRKIVIS